MSARPGRLPHDATFAQAFLVALFVAAFFGFARAAWAAPPLDITSADRLFETARREDESAAFAAALAHYTEVYERAPSCRFAPQARGRAGELRAHAEGDFRPFAALERVRRSAELGSDPAALATLARAAETFPPGLVRVEARTLVAEAYLGRLGRREEGVALMRSVARDEGADPVARGHAATRVVRALLEARDLDGAAAEVRAHAGRVDALLVKTCERLLRRRALHRGAIGLVALFSGLALLSVALAARRGDARKAFHAVRSWGVPSVLFALYVAFVGGYLASAYEGADGDPFYFLGGALLGIGLVARAWGAVGRPGAPRVGRAALAAGVAVAAAFLVLEATEPSCLETFGL